MIRTLVTLSAVACILGCGERGGEGAVVATDSRYRVTAHAVPPPAVNAPGRLRLHVQTLNGWHVTAEAPARLDLAGPETLTFEPAELRQQDARPLGEDAFEFVTTVRADRAGSATAHATLKFGICEGPKAKCVIVRRELELPIEVAAGR